MGINPARILAHDRRGSALHEAGHLVVAWSHGIHAEAMIKNVPTDDMLETKQWWGRVRFLPALRRSKDPTARLEIAVAGEIANWHGTAAGYPEGILEPETWAEYSVMSPTDWDVSGYEGPEAVDRRFMRAVERVNNLIEREWPTVCRVARDLIVRAR
jgi:hypothetical protein